jgi:hypothetical protein
MAKIVHPRTRFLPMSQNFGSGSFSACAGSRRFFAQMSGYPTYQASWIEKLLE